MKAVNAPQLFGWRLISFEREFSRASNAYKQKNEQFAEVWQIGKTLVKTGVQNGKKIWTGSGPLPVTKPWKGRLQ